MRNKSIAKENIAPGIVCTAPWRLTKVTSLPNYSLEVDFVDGTHGIVEMSGLIMSEKAGIFATLKNTSLFNQVHIEHGVVTWPGEIDLAPDAMHRAVKETGTWVVK
ncbi:MAG TPA: DUF2442 domain-containing protein [Gammaproteobacteria bacterium]|nr:DUF2442 domain-containing protein [Gammaproteobacteria bacterium]